MWMGSYGNERADLKLLAIRFMRKIWILLLAALFGGAIFGLTYFVKKIVLAPAPEYRTYSMLYVDFVRGNGKDPLYYSFNDAGWDGFVRTDTIIDKAIPYLAVPLPKEEIRESVSASLDSDYRSVELLVTHANQDTALAIAHAMEQGFVEFAGEMREFEQIRIMTAADKAERIWIPTYLWRAVLWGVLLAAAAVLFIMLLKEVLDDAVYVPEIFEKRYRIPMLGAVFGEGKSDAEEIRTNLAYLKKDSHKLAVVGVGAITAAAENELKQALSDETGVLLKFFPELLKSLGQVEEIQSCDGIILDIPAGKQNGKLIEKLLSLLEKQDCKVIAAILTDAEEGLLKKYYFGHK